MREIMLHWPDTLALPIMPTGAIPLASDLVRTPTGYVVRPSAAHKCELAGSETQLHWTFTGHKAAVGDRQQRVDM